MTCRPALRSELVLDILGRGDEAIRAFDAVLRVEPDHELALRSASRVLGRLHRLDEAGAMLRRTIAVNPWRSDYRLALAKVCYEAGDWAGVIAACREAIRLDPNLLEARSILIEGLLRSNNRHDADAEFRTLLRFSPASREVWEQWYEGRKNAGQAGANPATTVHP